MAKAHAIMGREMYLSDKEANFKKTNMSIVIEKKYIDIILEKSRKYMQTIFSSSQHEEFMKRIATACKSSSKKDIIESFIIEYVKFIKEKGQNEYDYDVKLSEFIDNHSKRKYIWGDCYNVLKSMKSESVHCMVTSPPYYNAREYAQWKNLNAYLGDMRKVIAECFRVLDNHRVFVFNVGDIFDNDNEYTTSTWGKRRIPLAAYFINIFEEEGFTFVDDIIWDKGEVQSERHKNNNKPYPFYQYPMNCYEHILIFHKHRKDMTRYPCPVCGTLNVNGNAYTEKGLKSWECKNRDCEQRSLNDRGKRFSLKTLQTQSNIKREGSEIEKDYISAWRRDIKKINPVIKINSKGENIIGHTAPFPIEIPEYAVKMFSYAGEKVLDPFAGVGTSVKAAANLGRQGIGIEIDKKLEGCIYKFFKGKKIDTIAYSNA